LTTQNFFIDESEIGKCLVLTGDFENSIVDYMRSNQINSIRLSQSVGWKEKDISFLKNLPFLKGVEIYSDSIRNIKTIENLKYLELLGLECKFNESLDVSELNLKMCKLRWNKNIIGLFQIKSIELLNIVNFPMETLEAIKDLGDLKRLQITSKSLKSLTGINNLKKLKVLDVFNCPELTDVIDISNLNLLKVEMRKCKKVEDIISFGTLTNLEELLIEDCGDIRSIKLLQKTVKLKAVSILGNTRVEDGDIGVLLQLPNLSRVWFKDYKHYSHKLNEIKALM